MRKQKQDKQATLKRQERQSTREARTGTEKRKKKRKKNPSLVNQPKQNPTVYR